MLCSLCHVSPRLVHLIFIHVPVLWMLPLTLDSVVRAPSLTGGVGTWKNLFKTQRRLFHRSNTKGSVDVSREITCSTVADTEVMLPTDEFLICSHFLRPAWIRYRNTHIHRIKWRFVKKYNSCFFLDSHINSNCYILFLDDRIHFNFIFGMGVKF